MPGLTVSVPFWQKRMSGSRQGKREGLGPEIFLVSAQRMPRESSMNPLRSGTKRWSTTLSVLAEAPKNQSPESYTWSEQTASPQAHRVPVLIAARRIETTGESPG
jgi:hypothetical protein